MHPQGHGSSPTLWWTSFTWGLISTHVLFQPFSLHPHLRPRFHLLHLPRLPFISTLLWKTGRIPSKDMKRDIPHLLNRILRFAQVIQVWNASFLCCTWSDGVFAVEGRHDLPFVLLKVPACFSTCLVLGKRICPADFASASPHQACRHSFASHSPIPKGRGTVASALYYVQPFKALIAESTVQ